MNFGSSSETFAHCGTSLNTGACKVTPSCCTSLFGWVASDILLFTTSGAFVDFGGCEEGIIAGAECFLEVAGEGFSSEEDLRAGDGLEGTGREGTGWEGAGREGAGREGAGREGAGLMGATFEETVFGAGASGVTSLSVLIVLVMAGVGLTEGTRYSGRSCTSSESGSNGSLAASNCVDVCDMSDICGPLFSS